jgi:hypothetical protein
MDTLVFVVAHKFGDDRLELSRRLVLRVPQTLACKSSKPAFYDHVIPLPGLAVHALSYALVLEQLDVGIRAEDRALVAISARRRCLGRKDTSLAQAQASCALMVSESLKP